MEHGKHTPPGDRSFAVSVLVHLAAGVALVAAVAGAFWGIGQVRGPEDGPVIIGAPDDESPTVDETSSPPQETAPVETPAAPDPAESDEPDEVEPEPDPTPTATIAPGDVSVQVLDATGDGGERMRAAVEVLRGDGWRIVATNRASRYYERSTVFYSPGHEEAASLLAERYPQFQIVREKPESLTSSVAVHVVIGGDYPEP